MTSDKSESSARWTRGRCEIRKKSYDADGSCTEERDGILWGDFCILKDDGLRFQWNLTYVPTGQKVAAFRLQASAKSCAYKLTLSGVEDKKRAYAIVRECQIPEEV